MVHKFTQLCPVTFGAGAVKSTGKIAAQLGFKKVLVITDENVDKLGHTQKAINSLEEAGIDTILFNRCEMDSPDYIIQAGANIAKNEKVDGIVGIGGGSVLDTSKGISLLSANDMDIDSLLLFTKESKPIKNPPMKLILIPTTSGTGSECTVVAVIKRTKFKEKIGVLSPAVYAIVDAELTLGMPKSPTVYTGMDALSHACEALTSIQPNMHSDILCYDTIERITKWLPIAAKDAENLEARENLALASNSAGIAFNDAMVHIGHAIAHSIGATFLVPHGICCALTLPVVLELTSSVYPEKVKRIGEIMGLSLKSTLTPEEIGKKVADNVREFMKKLDVPSFKEIGMSREDASSCTNYVANERLRNLCSVAVSEADITKLLTDMYDLYQ